MRDLHWNGSVAMRDLRGLLLNPRDKRLIRVINLIILLQNKQEETLVQIKITFSKAKKKLSRKKKLTDM